MYSPHKAHTRFGNLGKPLPPPYECFTEAKATFRRGGTSMIAGTPGAFKTVLALNMVVKWASEGIRTHYFSADGDEFTVYKRLAGIVTGYNMDEVEKRIARRRDAFSQELKGALYKRAEFEYSKMEWETLVEHVASYEQQYGGYPDLIVIDNLIDFAPGGPYDFTGMQEIISNADTLAKQTSAHVLILHHAKLKDEDSTKDDGPPPGQPPADWEIQGRMTQFPTLALTLGAIGMQLRMAVVKNRNGPQYKDARVSHPFQVNYSMRVVER